MSPDAGVFLVLPVHHRHRVPSDQALDATLQLAVTGIGNFLRRGNGIEVRCIELHGDIDARVPRALNQRTQ